MDRAPQPAATTPPPEDVPEVADAVGARAHGLRRMAEQMHETVGDELAGALRAHAGHVDALAEHLRDAGRPSAARGAEASEPETP